VSFVIDVDSERPNPMYRTRHFADCPVFGGKSFENGSADSHETRVFKRIIVEEEIEKERERAE